VVICRLHYEEQSLILLIIVVIKVPELFLRFPPLDNTAEAGDRKEYLHVPIAAVPIRVVVPRFADGLHPLYDGLNSLWLRRKVGNSHINDVGRDRYEFIEIGHDRINGVVNKDTGRTAVA
jgi:hypothetical protein